MQRFFLYTVIALAATACTSTQPKLEYDQVEIRNTLRAPAYPLVTIDPYTSAWSMTENLYDSPVRHWTEKDFPFIGVLKVDGTLYRFMGTEELDMRPIVPTSEQGGWIGRYTTTKPADSWTGKDFDDSSWQTGPAAFGTMENEPMAKTQWGSEQIWVRRSVRIDEDLSGTDVYLEVSHDDDAIFYINGVEAYSTGMTTNKNKVVKISDEAKAALTTGENIIAAECNNPVANGLLDFGLLIPKDPVTVFHQSATQLYADVQPTQTHYGFECGPVELRLTFTAPLFMDDLDLLTRPVNYISYAVESKDGQAHDIEVYFEASPRWATHQPYQPCTAEAYEDNGLVFLKVGTKEQDILAKEGDDLRIDWGYFYLTAAPENTRYGVGSTDTLRDSFAEGNLDQFSPTGEDDHTHLALIRTHGAVREVSDKILIGYDDLYSINYFGTHLRPYWNKDGQNTFENVAHQAYADYSSLMAKCYDFDNRLMKEAVDAGGQDYAELCALAYRQSISAHKLVEAPNGDLLWISKENNSNGCMNTVDLTYPSSPLYLIYNPDLVKGMMNGIFYYSESGKWTFPFSAHDLGTYPIALGQKYGDHMPIEESGNMLILSGVLAKVEGNADYARKHWETLTIWTDYLVENGLDPENQLCTDDFAGHFAHNANLSIKAIMGIASYGSLAKELGYTEVYEKYTAIAQEMANKWQEMADDGDHYRLTFDKAGTWSQKYNLVWDELLGYNLFDKKVVETEIPYYLSKQNIYGLPLDNRDTFTKVDWVLWTATMAADGDAFRQLVAPMRKFMNETTDRVPMSDWIYTDKPNRAGFKARSVVGGVYMQLLKDKLD